MRRRAGLGILGVCAALLGPASPAADAPVGGGRIGSNPGASQMPPSLEGVGIDQKLGASVPLQLVFRDELGRPITLEAAIDGKPAILNLAYYECPMLCTLVVNGLLTGLRALPFDVGKEFRIVTVSIDPTESHELAAAKKKNVLDEYGRPAPDDGWRFLTGDEASIRALADSVGFRYRYDEEHKMYAHAAGIVVLTPGGTVARYFYGIDFATRDMRLALVDASEGRVGSLTDQMMLFCYQYDPATARYSIALLSLVRAGGALTVLFVAGFILISRRREARRARRSAVSIGPTHD